MGTLTLTNWQRHRLQRQLQKTHDARVYRRTLAVLEVSQGEPVGAVARRLQVTPRVVYYWLKAYTQNHAPDALRAEERSGRPRLLNQQHQACLLELLQHSPQEFGYLATQWTVPLLRTHLTRSTGLCLSEDTLRRELHRRDYVWKRPRYVLDPDPQLRGKKATYPSTDPAVAATKRGAGRGRDGPAAVSASASRLVASGTDQAGGD
jgi:transposase